MLIVAWLLTGWPGALAAEVALIPIPAASTAAGEPFVCRRSTVIRAGPGARGVAEQLSEYLRPATGYGFPVTEGAGEKAGAIQLSLDRNSSRFGKEGYRLEVGADRIVLRAAAPAGLFYGVQTLRQLLPAGIYSAAKSNQAEWTVPAFSIEDKPRFEWRGAMVDVARHFMPKAGLYRFIDAMAAIKLNHLHIHLTDTQAWRIEIRKYPQLAAQRRPTLDEQAKNGCKCGLQTGYYTQDDLRQIVAYAAARYITVIPEIDMPGHAGAGVAAMPELGNLDARMPDEKGSPYRLRVFSPSEKSIAILQDVLAEVLDIFPSELIHIGGDEVRKDEWQNSPAAQARMRELGLKSLDEIQSYMIARMQKFLAARGRRLVGWSEITQGGLVKQATVMAWNQSADSAIEAGHDVVATPGEFTYFDHYQTHDPREPLSHHYYLPLKRAYAFDPAPPGMPAAQARHMLGAQGQLWTTYMPTPYHLEYMAFPRLAALAEVVWSPVPRKDYESFKHRLLTQQERWKAMGVNFRPLDATTDDEPY